jgi:hypothetical protein
MNTKKAATIVKKFTKDHIVNGALEKIKLKTFLHERSFN